MKHLVRNMTVTGATIGFVLALLVGFAMGHPPWSDLNFLIPVIGALAVGGSFAIVGLLGRKILAGQLSSTQAKDGSKQTSPGPPTAKRE